MGVKRLKLNEKELNMKKVVAAVIISAMIMVAPGIHSGMVIGGVVEFNEVVSVETLGSE